MKKATKRTIFTFLLIFCFVFSFPKKTMGTSMYNEGFIEFKEDEQRDSSTLSLNEDNEKKPKDLLARKRDSFPKMGDQRNKNFFVFGILLIFLGGIAIYWRKQHEK